MKTAIIFACMLAMVFAYDDLDDYDWESLVQNDDELLDTIYCFLDKKPCSPIMQQYRDHVQDAVDNACGKCTKRQSHTLRVFIEAFVAKFPAEFQEFTQKYDPTGTKTPILMEKLPNF